MAKKRWDMSNPLYRWLKRKGKLNKSPTRHMSTVRPMTRTRKRRSYKPRFLRRFRRKKQPISILKTGAALGIGFMMGKRAIENTGASITDPSSWGKVIEHPMNALDGLLTESVGYSPMNNTWDFGAPLRNIMIMAAAGGGSWLATRMGINTQIRRLPYVGKYIKL